LLSALSLFHDVDVKLIAPHRYRLGDEEFQSLTRSGLRLKYADAVDEVIPHVDVIYHSGLSEDPDEPVTEGYLLTAAKLRSASDGLTVLHPLPRHGEILPDVDGLSCAGYFRQAAAGVPVRMAILESVLA
jgi:aspartate carbamoyltransferase catalytic subunit